MKIYGTNIAAVSAAGAQYAPHTVTKNASHGANARFDSVTITPREGSDSAFAMSLKSRLAQQVRSATTSGMVASLREQVQSGAYQPDPAAIAREILLMGGTE